MRYAETPRRSFVVVEQDLLYLLVVQLFFPREDETPLVDNGHVQCVCVCVCVCGCGKKGRGSLLWVHLTRSMASYGGCL